MYKIILAFRYMFKRRISYLAFSSVALSVFIIVVVMTIMSGLVSDFRDKNHRFVGDCIISTDSLVGFAYYEDFIDILNQQDFTKAASPVIKTYALFSPYWTQQSVGLEVMGIDPLSYSAVTGFADSLHYCADDVSHLFNAVYDSNQPACVFGIEIRLTRGRDGRYSYGTLPSREAWTVSFVPLTIKGAPAKAGTSMVSTKTFYTTDYSASGLARVDNSVVYLPFEHVQSLTAMTTEPKRTSAIAIKFHPGLALEPTVEKVSVLWDEFIKSKSTAKNAELLKNVTVQSWKTYRRSLIAAMEKEQMMMTALFSLMAITTVFIIFVVFYMIINHKSKDIGILKSVGVCKSSIISLFLGFAFLVGFFGSVVGLLGGWLFLLKVNRIEHWLLERFGFQLWDRSIYAIDDIPNQLGFCLIAVVLTASIFVCLAGALLPSWLAARLKPVETLAVNRL